MNDIPNHFQRAEQLLRYRREALKPFDSMARDETTFDLQRQTNLLFYKAIIEEMRKLVDAHDAEFKSEGGQ